MRALTSFWVTSPSRAERRDSSLVRTRIMSVKSRLWWLIQLLKLNTLLLLTVLVKCFGSKIRFVVKEFNFMQTKIHVDNESAICVVKNPVCHSKTKHIEIQNHFIRDSYEKRLIEMVKIHTDYNVLDLLTKAFDMTSFSVFGDMQALLT
ncbi:hypothetical protein Tco_0223759 [Tanacetum coccineum]